MGIECFSSMELVVISSWTWTSRLRALYRSSRPYRYLISSLSFPCTKSETARTVLIFYFLY